LREWPALTEAEVLRILDGDTNAFEQAVARACVDDPSYCNAKMDTRLEIKSKVQRARTEIQAATNQTLQPLSAGVNGLSRLGGRKTMLLMSEGFVAAGSWPLVQQVVGAASRVSARIYTQDARGLNRGGRSLDDNDPHDDWNASLLASMDLGADSLNSLAVD